MTASATSDSTAATTSAVGGSPCANRRMHAVAGLDQHRERLERLEGGGQPTSVALVVMTLLTGEA